MNAVAASSSSIIKPQLSFNKSLDHLPFWAKLSLVRENVQMGSGKKTSSAPDIAENGTEIDLGDDFLKPLRLFFCPLLLIVRRNWRIK